MKWDGQTSAVVGSAVVTIATVVGTAIALGMMIQAGLGEINSDVRELRSRIDNVESSLRAEIRNVESSLRTEIRNVESSLRTEIDGIEGRLRNIEVSVTSIQEQVTNIKDYLMNIDGRVSRIEFDLFEIGPEPAQTP